jgi:glycosyltransferase involved in cell wall biosynthesis
MKILVIQDLLRSGGTERQSVLLANAFAAAGHASTLLTFRPGGALTGSVDPGVTRLTLQSFDTRLDWYAPGLRRTLEVLQPDVILCMGRMANCAAGHIVNIVQDRWPDAVVLATMRTGKCLPWRFRRSLSAVRHIIANSAAARTTLMQEHGISADKISVIHNPLVFPPVADGESAESTARATLRSNHGATARTTVLLNVAMFRPEKNQAELITSAATLPADFDWQLWLAGDGPARAACEALSTRLSLTKRVKFLGFLRDPSAVYAAADLAVHASRSESLSNFLIEAQAHGLPAVAYEAQGIGECFLPGEPRISVPPSGTMPPPMRPAGAAPVSLPAPHSPPRGRCRPISTFSPNWPKSDP